MPAHLKYFSRLDGLFRRGRAALLDHLCAALARLRARASSAFSGPSATSAATATPGDTTPFGAYRRRLLDQITNPTGI